MGRERGGIRDRQAQRGDRERGGAGDLQLGRRRVFTGGDDGWIGEAARGIVARSR